MEYDEEFLGYINDIIESPYYQITKKLEHHENETVYEHSMKVAYASYLYAKKHKLNKKDISIGAILHDFYSKSWKDEPKKTFFKKHGFVHARDALENSRKYFSEYLNPRIEDIIVKHMFPLNIKLPRYKESWVVVFIDKKCSLEVLKHPSKYLNYLGFK